MNRDYLFALVIGFWIINLSPLTRADDVVIENLGKRTFYYSIREGTAAAWSKTYEIAPGAKQSHPAAPRLRISYLTDAAKFDWLDANKVYRINDVAKGQLRVVTEVRRPASGVTPGDAGTSPTAGSGELPEPSTATPPNSGAEAAASPANTPPTASRAPASDDTTSDDTTSDDTTSDDTTSDDTTSSDTTSANPTAADPTDVEEPLGGLFDLANRVVTIRAIADDTYRNAFPSWRERIPRIIAGASDYYQRKYAIRLILTETQEWDYEGVADDLETRWSRLLEQSPDGVDLIVALVGYGDYSSVQGEAAFTGQLGRAAFFGQHLMAVDRKDYHENRAKTVLIHELGHVFGAFHVADQNLMMYPGYLQLPTDAIIAGTVPFGAVNDQVFELTKEFEFRRGVNSLSPEVQRTIQALYRRHGLARESRQTDPITSAYEYLERRAKIVSEQMAVRAQAARGAFDGLPE